MGRSKHKKVRCKRLFKQIRQDDVRMFEEVLLHQANKHTNATINFRLISKKKILLPFLWGEKYSPEIAVTQRGMKA